MTKRASELIKELAELNEKVYKLELELKEELTRELTEKFVFTTREEAIKYLSEANEGYNDFLKATAEGTAKQPVPENKEYKKDNYERYKNTDLEEYFEDPYDEDYDDDEPEEDYVWENPTNEACWDCNNPRCKKGRLNNIYLKDILPQGNFVEYLFRQGNRTVCDLMYDAKERVQMHSVNFDNVMRCFCKNEDLYRLYRELLMRDIPMINYNRYNIDYSKNIEDSDFKKSIDSYVDNGIISVAVGNALRRANCYSIGDIKLLKDLNELKKTRTIGKKTFEKIMEFIEKENIL